MSTKTSYRVVEGSQGNAPRFSITLGLREGYGPNAKTHSVEKVVSLTEAYLKGCASRGEPFLPGIVTTGVVVYAWSEGSGVTERPTAGSGNEQQASYGGNINPLYHSSLTCNEVEGFLNGLASALGSALGQTRVYVEFDGQLWILQQSASETPTGEKVA